MKDIPAAIIILFASFTLSGCATLMSPPEDCETKKVQEEIAITMKLYNERIAQQTKKVDFNKTMKALSEFGELSGTGSSTYKYGNQTVTKETFFKILDQDEMTLKQLIEWKKQLVDIRIKLNSKFKEHKQDRQNKIVLEELNQLILDASKVNKDLKTLVMRIN